jgi:hypothetical protein
MSEMRESGPPEAPEFDRRVELNWTQLIGVPLIMLLPVLALLGLFGQTFDTAVQANDELELHVRYATRFRHGMVNPVEVTVRNLSAQTVENVRVEFDDAYLGRFIRVTFKPEVARISQEAYTVALGPIAPGESRRVVVTVEADEYGRHHGRVTAAGENGPAVVVSLTTTIFP